MWLLRTPGIVHRAPLSSESPANWQLDPEQYLEIAGIRSDPLGKIADGIVSIHQEAHNVWLSPCNVNSYGCLMPRAINLLRVEKW